MTVERFQLFCAVHLLLFDGDRLLLLRRLNTGYGDGQYGLIAGHLEGGETARAALLREAAEEAGIDVRQEDLRFVHVMHSTTLGESSETSRTREYVHIFFTANRWYGIPRICEPSKCDDLRWCDVSSLPDNVIPYVREAIDYYRAEVPFAEFGWE